MKRTFTYFYHVAMAFLAISNSIFLLYNVGHWNVEISETSTILTFIGFIFAFSGMYIYSIFNTNVEREKREIRELKAKYEKELIQANQGVLTVSKLLQFYQMGQLIVNSPQMNIDLHAWIAQIKSLYKKQTEYIRELYKSESPIYANYRADFRSVCRGLSQSLSVMIKRIEEHKDIFFAGANLSKIDKQNLIDRLNNLQSLLMKDIDVTDNPEPQPIAKPKDKSFCKRLKRAWKVLIGDCQ